MTAKTGSVQELKEEYLRQVDFIGVKCEFKPLYKKIYTGNMRTVPGLLTIKTGTVYDKNAARSPLNLCLVLDVSGSMQGPKLDNSKRALLKVFEQLIPGDKIHLVTYSNDSQIIFEGYGIEHREQMIEAVKAIETDGSTNLFAGLETGVNILNKYSKDFSQTTYLFIFSDGLVNAGSVTTKKQIFSKVSEFQAEHNIFFTSYGIGSDFDEDMMSGISRAGKSNFFYIDTDDRIPVLIQKGLTGVSSIVTKDASLMITGSNCQVTKVFDKTSGLHKTISVGTIREKSIINIPIEVTFSINESPELFFNIYFGDQFKMDRPDETQDHFVLCKIQPEEVPTLTKYDRWCQCQHVFTMASAVEWFEERITEDTEVKAFYVMEECIDIDMEATKAVSAGDATKAIDLKKKIIDKLESVKEFDLSMITEALYRSTRESLVRVQTEGISKEVRKYEMAKERRYEEKKCEDEEDGDMGFGLFD
jgi:Mg-chelatase subunit ChlD